MACTRPLDGWRSLTGQVVFKKADGLADRPITLSCGWCQHCRMEHARQWAIRCVHEAQLHEESCFLTLTYDPENIPHTPPTTRPNGYTGMGSLRASHWPSFIRSLRQVERRKAKISRREPRNLRYYICGEYGETTHRPHLHALLYGRNFSEDRRPSSKTPTGNQLYRSKELEKLWGKGTVEIGDVTYQSAGYVAKYVDKKITGDRAESHYGGRVPEFSMMSRKPGIGAGWLEKWWTDVYPSDHVVMDGKPQPPPKYYDLWLEANHPEVYKRVRLARIAKRKTHELLPKTDNYTWERTQQRERVHETIIKKRTTLYKREPNK